MGKLVRRVLSGYETITEWSPDDPSSVEAAQTKLEHELRAGYQAVRSDGERSAPVNELPADAELVILTMPMGGG